MSARVFRVTFDLKYCLSLNTTADMLINKVTSWSTVTPEKSIVVQAVKKFPTLHEIRRFIAVGTIACH